MWNRSQLFLLLLLPLFSFAQNSEFPEANLNYTAFSKLVDEVEPIRQERLIPYKEFIEMATDPGTIILDTRSKEAYNLAHLKGAINLPFSDFTSDKLDESLGRLAKKHTRILIYCNNNFTVDEDFIREKKDARENRYMDGISPPPVLEENIGSNNNKSLKEVALNILTFVTLHGYGYKNVYELSSLLDIPNPAVKLEITEGRRRYGKARYLYSNKDLMGIGDFPEANLDYTTFKELVKEVEGHRAERLVSYENFMEMAKEENTIILDTRSKQAFDIVHLEGAINLPYTDFTNEKLAAFVHQHAAKRILIYCNNNFKLDKSLEHRAMFMAMRSKSLPPPPPKEISLSASKERRDDGLALNLPTFISLYAYGYDNVFELSSQIYLPNEKIALEPKQQNLSRRAVRSMPVVNNKN